MAEDVLHLTSGCFQPNIASKDCGRWFTSIAKSCHEIGVHYVQQTARLPLINGARETFFLGRPIFTGCVCFGEGRLVYTQGGPLRFLFHVFSAPIDAGIILHEISSSPPKTWWLSTDSVTILPSKQRLGSWSSHHHTRPPPQFEAPNHTSGCNRWRTAVPFSYGPKTVFLQDFSKVCGLTQWSCSIRIWIINPSIKKLSFWHKGEPQLAAI